MAASVKRLGVTAYIGFPLLANSESFGTLAFATVSRAGFTESDVALARTLTEQCAAVLERGHSNEAALSKIHMSAKPGIGSPFPPAASEPGKPTLATSHYILVD